MELISVFRNGDTANMLIDYPMFTEFMLSKQWSKT